ncbi:MAG: bifunctional hydroxymethylpyrimidine kinase/phosphomethylpyrimidine kinase, partial [Rhodobacteraceae bacterium]|nr:bifunctional hydroxymethylpyrimidine kinase/phosphomethylpyrimidine kinase [Paracoccaceae bacterium]
SATRALVLQNEVPDDANVSAAKAVRRSGGLVLLNAAPARPPSPALAANIDVLVVNAIEAELLAGIPVVKTLQAAIAAAGFLSSVYPSAVVSAGGAGVAFAERSGTLIAIEAEKVRVASTHGAGDAFIGHLAAVLAGGAPMEQALREANRAAAVLVGTPEAERV